MIRIGVFLVVVLLINGCTTLNEKQIDRFISRCPEMSKDERSAHVKLPYFRPNPKYPAEAVRKGTEGYVIFEFDISNGGHPININLIESYPSDIFVNTAKRNFRGYRFKPIKYKDKPVISLCHTMRLVFKLG